MLLAFDPVYNSVDPERVPGVDAKALEAEPTTTGRSIQPWVLLKVKTADGKGIALCDFATAGAYGNYYRTWLPIHGVEPIPYTRDEAIWNNRPR